MISKATACLLVLLTISEPFVCCCTVGPALSWVGNGVLGGVGVPRLSACCHRVHAPKTASERVHAPQYDCHRQSDSVRPCERPHGQPQDCPCRCPYREEGSGGTASSSLVDWHALAIVASVILGCQGRVLVFHGPVSDLAPSTATDFFAPKGLCETGLGILRAYGRLRI